MAKVIGGTSIPNIPWQEKPAGCKDVVCVTAKIRF